MANQRFNQKWRRTPGKIAHPRSKVSGNEGGFKEFRIGDLFDSQTGDVDLQQSDVNGKGSFFINSGLENCGIKGKTDRQALKRIFQIADTGSGKQKDCDRIRHRVHDPRICILRRLYRAHGHQG